MALTDHPDDIVALLTDQARTYLARALNGELVYRLVGFSVGRGGYDPSDPVHIEPVDPSDTELEDQVYPDVTGYAAFEQIDQPDTTGFVLNCRLPATPTTTNADYALGEIGVWAQILTSNIPGEIGEVFLFALGHFPIRCKTHRNVELFRVITSF